MKLKESYYDKDTMSMNYYTEWNGNKNIWSSDTEEMNNAIMEEFYAAVDWLLSKGYEEYKELVSRTVNPAQQNAYIALREYRVKRNGHYKIVKIGHRFWGGCWIEEKAI